ncbi:MAG TPA: hypothetical protein PLW80_10975, partial [Spirochaetales bacterium]|nr:hypothetical protein [Spirochaetales bacterium]
MTTKANSPARPCHGPLSSIESAYERTSRARHADSPHPTGAGLLVLALGGRALLVEGRRGFAEPREAARLIHRFRIGPR